MKSLTILRLILTYPYTEDVSLKIIVEINIFSVLAVKQIVIYGMHQRRLSSQGSLYLAVINQRATSQLSSSWKLFSSMA